MSTGYRFAREVALREAMQLIALLQGACEQIEIAGSLRRESPTVGDIEIVAIPKVVERAIAPPAQQMSLFGGPVAAAVAPAVERESLLDGRLDKLAAQKVIYKERPYTHEKAKWGAKMKQFWLLVNDGRSSVITVDLFIVTPPAQWGPQFTIRTGPGDFSGAMGLMRWINERTPYQQKDGRLIVRATGEELQTPTERSYFEALGVPWIEPKDRTVARLWKAARGAKRGNVATPKPAQARRVYTTDSEIRAWIRARLEARAGICLSDY